MRYVLGTILALVGLSFAACGDSALSGDDTGDDSNVTNSPTMTPVIQKLNDGDNPTPPKPSGTDCTQMGSTPGTAVKAGDTVPKGTCAIIEIVDNTTKVVYVYGGTAPVTLTAGPQTANPNIHVNMWVGFETSARAASDVPGQVAERNKQGFTASAVTLEDLSKFLTDPSKAPAGNTPASAATPVPTTAPKVIVTVPTNDGSYVRLTGACTGNFPRGDGHVRSVDGGATVPAGTLVYVRHVDHNRAEEHHEFGCLISDTRAGKVSMVATDIWYGYASVVKTYAAACNQAIGDVEDARATGSWNFMYVNVLLKPDGSAFTDVPATCPN